MEKDKSILNHSAGTNGGQAINEYANDCIKEVCLNSEPLSKYQKMIEKQFGVEFYKKCDNFVKEIKRSVERKKFTNTSVANLELLAKEINIPLDTVNVICKHFTEQFATEEPPEIPNKPSGNKGLIWGIVVLAFIIIGVIIAITMNNNSSNYEPDEPYNPPIVNPEDTVDVDDTGPVVEEVEEREALPADYEYKEAADDEVAAEADEEDDEYEGAADDEYAAEAPETVAEDSEYDRVEAEAEEENLW